MGITSGQLAAAVDALTAVQSFTHPADAVLGDYFRAHRALGPLDRAFIAESVFGVLRRKLLLDHLAGSGNPRAILLLWLARFGGRSTRELAPLLQHGEADWLAEKKSVPLDALPLPLRADLPEWVVDELKARMPESEILALGRAMQQAAPLDLRVNTLRMERDAALKALAQSGIEGTPTPYSPLGIRIEGRPALQRHPLFLDGSVEVQDEGSQLLGFLLAPRRHELVVDFCAGAGGKALMLGAMMASRGRVYAFDVSSSRLAKLKPRLRRSGLSNLHPHLIRDEHDTKVKRLGGKIDRVLVDAPCSGMGTLRRNPDLKWRQSPASVRELVRKQASILRAASGLVKRGGRLVYATCSLLPRENDEIVAAFLHDNAGFRLVPAAAALAEQRIALATGDYLQLYPHLHGTDGFFAAVLQREP
jgi:16S rRNA (cytosine967-C5)-methyltransferase